MFRINTPITIRNVALSGILLALMGLLFLAAAPPAGAQTTTGTPVPGLTVAPVSGSTDKLDVSWDAVTDADQYIVKWKSGDDLYQTTTTADNTVDAPTTSKQITGLTADTEYSVEVSAYGEAPDRGLLAQSEAISTTNASDADRPNIPAKRAGGIYGFIFVFKSNSSVTFQMPEGTGARPLTYSLKDLSGGVIQNTLTLPTGLTWDPETRVISGTPTVESFSSTYSYTVTDADGDVQPGTYSFIIGVESEPEYISALSVITPTDALEVLDVHWTPSSATGVTGYLVQWRSSEQEFSTTERSHTTAADASYYQITDLEPGTEYSVKVTQQGGESDGSQQNRYGWTRVTRELTVVRGGPAQTYRVKLPKQPPVGVAVYPTQDRADAYAQPWEWNSGQELNVLPALGLFTSSNWNDYQEFSVSAPADSSTGLVKIYHDFIWNDGTSRSDFSVGSTTVKIVDPPSDDIVATITGGGTVIEGLVAVFTVNLSSAAPTGGLTVNVSIGNGTGWDIVTEGPQTVTVPAGQTSAVLNVPTLNIHDGYPEKRIATATLTTGEGYVLGTPSSASVAVTNAPPPAPPPADSPAIGGSQPPAGEEENPAASFVIYHDPDAGAAAVSRYNQATTLLTGAGVSHTEVTGDVQADVDRLSGVTNSVLPRFFLGDPTGSDWTSEPGVNNGGLRWLKQKVSELEAETTDEPPANSPASGAPRVSGTAQVGQQLTADVTGISDTDGLDDASFSYQWLADGSELSGATGSSYTPVSADVGKAISVRVSFTDDGGNAETLVSAATAAVEAEATSTPEPTASFVVYHDPDAGAAAVSRYNQATTLLTEAGVSYTEVTGDIQADVDRLAGVSNSVLPRFFLGDPTGNDWTSETGVNNGGLRWLKQKVAELSGD